MHFTGTNRRLFREFCSSYQTIKSPSAFNSTRPFVYVSKDEIKLITDVLDFTEDGGIFAVSVAENGIIEVLST